MFLFFEQSLLIWIGHSLRINIKLIAAASLFANLRKSWKSNWILFFPDTWRTNFDSAALISYPFSQFWWKLSRAIRDWKFDAKLNWSKQWWGPSIISDGLIPECKSKKVLVFYLFSPSSQLKRSACQPTAHPSLTFWPRVRWREKADDRTQSVGIQVSSDCKPFEMAVQDQKLRGRD